MGQFSPEHRSFPSSIVRYFASNQMKVYGKHNVLEYWMIHPVKKWVKVFENEDGKMVESVVLEEEGSFESKAVEGFVLDVGELFR